MENVFPLSRTLGRVSRRSSLATLRQETLLQSWTSYHSLTKMLSTRQTRPQMGSSSPRFPSKLCVESTLSLSQPTSCHPSGPTPSEDTYQLLPLEFWQEQWKACPWNNSPCSQCLSTMPTRPLLNRPSFHPERSDPQSTPEISGRTNSHSGTTRSQSSL